jgi:hypothetical protein
VAVSVASCTGLAYITELLRTTSSLSHLGTTAKSVVLQPLNNIPVANNKIAFAINLFMRFIRLSVLKKINFVQHFHLKFLKAKNWECSCYPFKIVDKNSAQVSYQIERLTIR